MQPANFLDKGGFQSDKTTMRKHSPLLIGLLLLASPSFAQTRNANPETLQCEIVDLVWNRVLDQGAAAVSIGSAPIAILLGTNSIRAAIRDVAGETPADRVITMEVDYETARGAGHGTAYGRYRLDKPATGEPVAQMQVEASLWERPTAIRCFALAQPPGSNALDPTHDPEPLSPLDSTTYETGNGYASGFCSGNMSYFCMNNLKERARYDATRSAAWSCQGKQGRPDPYATCNDFCTPFSIPPDAPQTYVNCNATCTIRCTVPN